MRTWEYDELRPDVWTWLQAWYVSQCNGDWEHRAGVEIGTLDNPGWHITVDLAGARGIPSKPFVQAEVFRSDDDWHHARVDEDQFKVACGPTNLAEALHLFRVWITSASEEA